jgi:hypothetical protein
VNNLIGPYPRVRLEGGGRAVVSQAGAVLLVEQYVALEKQPDVGLVLLVQYMQSDPARWTDWIASVRRGLSDTSTINPHE